MVRGDAPPVLIQVNRAVPAIHGLGRVAYEDLTAAVKNDIRAQLYVAQNGRCAYCEERISADSRSSKIEHFHPQNPQGPSTAACTDRTGLARAIIGRADVTWRNLLLCCLGNQGSSYAAQTCDTRKANVDICESSYNPRYIPGTRSSLVSVGNDGVATAVYHPDAQASAQLVIDNVLNLNLRRLKDNRSLLFSEYLDRFTQHSRRASTAQPRSQLREKFLDKIRQDIAGGAGYPSTLASIAVYIEERAGA